MMRILWRELMSRRKSLLLWMVGVTAYMVMSFGKYSTIAGDAEAIGPLLSAFPETIQAVLGMSGLDMTTIVGYYGVVYLYLLLLLAVHAGIAGTDVVIDDERDHTAEFIYTRPIGRFSILTQKILAGLVIVTIIWGVAAASSYLSMAYFADPSTFNHKLWILMSGAALVQWFSYALGVMAAGVQGSGKNAMRVVASFVFESYLLYTFEKFTGDAPWASALSIFSWFDAAELLGSSGLTTGTVSVAIFGGLIAIAIGYLGYLRRDIHS